MSFRLFSQQFNKSTAQLLQEIPLDGVIPASSLNSHIIGGIVVVDIIGSVTVSIVCRLQFPTFLQHLQDLPLLNLYMSIHQESMDVIRAEGKLGKVVSFHHVQTKLHHIQFGTRSVVPDDISFGLNHMRLSQQVDSFRFLRRRMKAGISYLMVLRMYGSSLIRGGTLRTQ